MSKNYIILTIIIIYLNQALYIEAHVPKSIFQTDKLRNHKDISNFKKKRETHTNIHNITSIIFYKNISSFPYLINFNLSLLQKSNFTFIPFNQTSLGHNNMLINSSGSILAIIDEAINAILLKDAMSVSTTPSHRDKTYSTSIDRYDQSMSFFRDLILKSNQSTLKDEDQLVFHEFGTNFDDTLSMYDEPNVSMDTYMNASFPWIGEGQTNLTPAYDDESLNPPNLYGAYTLGQYVIIIILTVLLSTMTILGNLLVLFSFVIERTLRQPTNYYIVSLAVSDLIIGMVSMPFYSLYLLLGSWPLGELLCDLWLSIDYTVCLASQYTVFFITLDRYCSVKIPASYRQWRTAFKVKFMIYCAWAIPIFIFFSAIIGWQYIFKSRGVEPNQCYVPFRDNRVFNTSLIFFYYWSTLVVLVSLYAGIYKVAYDLSRKSIEKEKRARALVEHAINNRLELKKSGKDAKIDRLASTARGTKMSNALQILKEANKDYPDETTSFSRDDQTKEKEKSSSVSFPSDSDTQDDNSYNKVSVAEMPKTKKSSRSKDKNNAKNNSKKKSKNNTSSPKAIQGNKNQYAMNHLEPMRLLTQRMSLINDQEKNDMQIIIPENDISKNAENIKEVKEEETIQTNDELEENPTDIKFDVIESDIKVQDDEEKEREINKVLHSIKNFNIHITTNTRAVADGDEYDDEESSNDIITDVPDTVTKKDKHFVDLSITQTPKHILDILRDRKTLDLPGLEEAYGGNGKKDRASKDTTVPNKNSLKNSLSFQSTATTLTPLTPYTSNDTLEVDNDVKDSLISPSLSPPTIDTPASTQTLLLPKAKSSQNINEVPEKRGSGVVKKGIRIKSEKRCNSLISNIVSFGKRSSNDGNKYTPGSMSVGDDTIKGKREDVTSGDKGSSESKSGKREGAVGADGKKRKSLSIIIKFKKRRKENSERKKSKSENRARKALRTITCIMGAFVLCWTPYHICETIRGFNPDFPINEHFYSFTYWLCYLNSPLNPFMYALANQQFKKTFIRILKFDLHKN